MTRSQHRPDGPREKWTRIALAVLVGLLTGAGGAITDWLLHLLPF
jgi:LPS O-antigen subunit length determinant protein (WzzB/FepE family)